VYAQITRIPFCKVRGLFPSDIVLSYDTQVELYQAVPKP